MKESYGSKINDVNRHAPVPDDELPPEELEFPPFDPLERVIFHKEAEFAEEFAEDPFSEEPHSAAHSRLHRKKTKQINEKKSKRLKTEDNLKN